MSNSEPGFVAATSYGSVKRDRFACLEGTFDTGILRTKPLELHGSTLHVNADVRFGRMQVSVLNPDGTDALDGTGEVGEKDSLDLSIPLDGLSQLKGRTVCLEFRLSNGRIYSFWMED